MTEEQVKLLSKMKKLIYKGNRKFLNRKDRNYLEELFEIGISESIAWNEILSLSKVNYCYDYKPSYYKNDDALIFKKTINGQLVYIKLKIEKYDNNEMTVCISFHIDHN